MKITIEERNGEFKNYIAYLNGNKKIWGCGRNSYEAIGDLIMHHKEVFAIEIECMLNDLEDKKDYKDLCCLCRKNYVDSDNGYDTCQECIDKM